MNKKKYSKAVRMMSPVGVVINAHLKEPMVFIKGDGWRPDEKGKLSFRLVVEKDAAEAFIKDIRSAMKENDIASKNFPWTNQTDENGDETGNVLFSFKTFGTEFGSSEKKKILYVDSAGIPVPSDVTVTAGSKVRTRFLLTDSNDYLQLRFEAIQIVDLKEADIEGFDALEEGSFVFDMETTADAAQADAGSTDF